MPFTERFKKIIWILVRRSDFGGFVLKYYPNSYLRSIGWFRSFREERSVDGLGHPIPWLTYSFLHFFEPRLKQTFRIFEYGCGYSTCWYAAKVKEVVAVENNQFWQEKISSQLPQNGKVIYKNHQDDYVSEIRNHSRFDIVIIDGVYREDCWSPANDSLLEGGVIIWDNSDREDFHEGYLNLRKYGFREIAFSGLAPSSFTFSQTSILYRPNNCLGI